MADASHRLVVVTGGPGSGKTTLIEALAAAGHRVMPEAGRAVIREQLAAGGQGLPWADRGLFAALMLERDRRSHAQALAGGGLFGVGLGGTMVQDGHAIRGARGNAGEIGHIPAVLDGEPCPCGNHGCLERYVSLEAYRRSRRGEAEWVADVRPIFHGAIVTIENLFDPETVVIGGLAPESLMERLAGEAGSLPNSVSAHRDRQHARIAVARGGKHSVLRGAAALAVSGALSPRFGQMFATARDQDEPAAQAKGVAA